MFVGAKTLKDRLEYIRNNTWYDIFADRRFMIAFKGNEADALKYGNEHYGHLGKISIYETDEMESVFYEGNG